MESVLRLFADRSMAWSIMELYFMGCDQWDLCTGRALCKGKSFYQKIPDIVKWAATMAIVFFSWQVFYFSDFNRLEVFMKSLIGISAANAAGTVEYTYRHYLTAKLIGLSAIAVLGATTFCMPWAEKVKNYFDRTKTGLFIKETGLILLMILSVIFLINSSYSPFLYFQY